MKKKYYYVCPIKALYMHIEFGVKFDTEIQISADLSSDNDFKNMTPDITKIYVAPESEHIFEPKEDDIGLYSKPFLRKLINFNALRFDGENWIYLDQNEDNAGFYDQVDLNSLRVDIIDRDGKHFFNPKEEN